MIDNELLSVVVLILIKQVDFIKVVPDKKKNTFAFQ